MGESGGSERDHMWPEMLRVLTGPVADGMVTDNTEITQKLADNISVDSGPHHLSSPVFLSPVPSWLWTTMLALTPSSGATFVPAGPGPFSCPSFTGPRGPLPPLSGFSHPTAAELPSETPPLPGVPLLSGLAQKPFPCDSPGLSQYFLSGHLV